MPYALTLDFDTYLSDKTALVYRINDWYICYDRFARLIWINCGFERNWTIVNPVYYEYHILPNVTSS